MVSLPRSVVVAGSGALADGLAEYYSRHGSAVTAIPFVPATGLPSGSEGQPLDLLVIADDFTPPRVSADAVTRADMADAMHRLVYWPFHTAAAFKSRLAAGNGRAVLLSSTSARMEHIDDEGLYLDRPFRTAAHALWRCLSVEWQPDAITCTIIGLDPAEQLTTEALSAAIAQSSGAFPVELTDTTGQRLGW